ncbi:MAG: lactate utilization protein [Rhodospirillaceae bacterium]|nr:lactate utilization protein [Rhodospirillaceae bacterium]
MSEARNAVLGEIRRSLGRPEVDREREAAADERIAAHPRGLIPARTDLGREARVRLFVTMAEQVAATVQRVDTMADVPGAVADYLVNLNLPPRLKVAPDPLLDPIDWSARPVLEVARGGAAPDDEVGVAAAFAGVAETGTLMLASGPGAPTRLNFLPDTHVVVLRTAGIVGPYEEAWDRLRGMGGMPRTVNMITGPSRTGDIEQQIQLGAHGPRRLHIVLVDQADG